MKLNIIKEDFDSIGSNEVIPDVEVAFTPDFDIYGTPMDVFPETTECPICGCEDCVCDVETVESNEAVQIYEDLEALGFVFMFASNDIHTIHINACGENFKQLHEAADELYKLLNDYSDHCLEICCEDGHYIHSLNDAKDYVNWEFCDCGEKPFTLKNGIQCIIDILNNVVVAITELYNDVPSDVQSVFDEWIRTLDSKMNYFLGRIVEVNRIFATESMMNPYLKRSRQRACLKEGFAKLKLGQPYKMFCDVEEHIEDYNCNPLDLKVGDYVIRDFQFGHLPNGGNKGYIPYEVTDIVYDDTSECNGYHDRRTRLELSDGNEYFYIVCQNDRFNGILHKLFKNSIM